MHTDFIAAAAAAVSVQPSRLIRNAHSGANERFACCAARLARSM